jgi:hypothetical protein
MGTNSLAGWVRRSPRYLLAILAVAAAAYAVDKWFFLGVTASKWIGLADHAALMRQTQDQSRNWGIAALVLELVAIILSLPIESSSGGIHIIHCLRRSVFCILGTVVLAFLHVVVANLLNI